MRWAFAQFDPNRGSKERVRPVLAQLAKPALAPACLLLATEDGSRQC